MQTLVVALRIKLEETEATARRPISHLASQPPGREVHRYLGPRVQANVYQAVAQVVRAVRIEDSRRSRRKKPTEKLPHGEVSNRAFSYSEAPNLHSGMAKNV
jgi:hypothetical protein